MSTQMQRGASLLEVLIAVVVLSFGLLGIAGMQASALRNNQSALERSQVVFLTYSILDAMRANIDTTTTPYSLKTSEYVLTNFTCEAPSATSLATRDLARWINNLHANLGDSACGRITCNAGVCAVQIRWNDSRGLQGDSSQTVETRSRL